MKLRSERTIDGLRDVLLDKNATGPEVAYWMYSEVSKDSWENITIITPGFYGNEFPKTYGHYHAVNIPETYFLSHGTGILILQKKHYENNQWIPDIVDEVLFITFEKPNQSVMINAEYGHAWVNIGNDPLISFDDWRSGHTDSDYADIKRLQGMAYYITQEKGEIKFVANSNYKNTPDPKFLSPDEYKKLF